MLAYHEADDREDPGRARRATPSRGGPQWQDDLGDHARGSRRSSRRKPRKASTPHGGRGGAQRRRASLGEGRGDPQGGVGAAALIVDAGPLIAYVEPTDRHHAECLELLETYPGPLVVPVLVIAEVAHLIQSAR